MADNKMLIDASHPEETRVVVLRDGRVEEFDYESAARKLLRGSIFLSKITRVEPSLQAAFVDYGGNRHGFLAFNEIHPDYYQIPHADRQALLEAEFGYQSRDDDDDDAPAEVEETESDDAIEEPASTELDAQQSAVNDDADDLAEAGEPDFEAEALDVSHLLPEEPSHDEAEPETETEAGAEPTETRAQLASIDSAVEANNLDASEHAQSPEADSADLGHSDPDGEAVAETASSTEESDHETDGQPDAEDVDGTDDASTRKPPKTIAAATPPDDRIVSEPVEISTTAGEADVGFDTAEITEATQEPEVEMTSSSVDSDTEVNSEEVEDTAPELAPESAEVEAASDDANDQVEDAPVEARSNDDESTDDEDDDEDAIVDEVGDSDALEEVPTRKRRRVRNYKIQEVIKRRQIVLVQVVKEERGNKGAALTTYLSLAGRYTVLMPNTARGGGISRKITNIQDRKRLKAIAQELDVPEGMGLIIRTAGAARTKQEIKRDFEYLLRLWESVRDLTLRSTAPSLVYEEGDLIKRSIRDLYSRDVEQVLVSGEEAYKEAKSFMRMLMPSHAKNVVKYEDAQPLFTRYRIEQQLNAMFSPFVQLKSGGYLVINQTEALVAVDVNSGKSTRKFSIEDTALNTNLEAAEELTRQLKLRDLAGLIVIDFIDMEEKRNNRAVERRLKECLRDDRARIQVGRISHFGLLEMSRQRLRTGVLEGSTMPCQHCQGTGIIRSTESVALAVLRGLEDQLMIGQPRPVAALCSRDAAMYLLNQKREFVQEIEARYGVSVHIEASDEHQGADYAIQRRNGPAVNNLPRRIEKNAVNVEAGFADETEERSNGSNAGSNTGNSNKASDTENGDGDEKRPRRRRRRRGRRGDGDATVDQVDAAAETVEDSEVEAAQSETDDADTDLEQGERQSRRRRRGRRGGRNSRGQRRGSGDSIAEPGAPQPDISDGENEDWSEPQSENAVTAAPEAGDQTDHAPQGEESVAASVVETNQPIETAEAPRAEAADNAPDTDDKGLLDTSSENTTSVDESSDPATEADNASDPEADATTVDMAAESIASEAIAEASVAEDVPVNSPRGEPESSEPVLERVVMTPESDGSEAAEAGQDVKEQPARKGWWQRRFGA